MVEPVNPGVVALIVFFLGVCDGLLSPIIFLAISDCGTSIVSSSEVLAISLIEARISMPANLACAEFMPVASITNFM